MKLFIKNILVGIAVIPLFFHIIILCVNVLRGNVEIRDDISHYKGSSSNLVVNSLSLYFQVNNYPFLLTFIRKYRH